MNTIKQKTPGTARDLLQILNSLPEGTLDKILIELEGCDCDAFWGGGHTLKSLTNWTLEELGIDADQVLHLSRIAEYDNDEEKEPVQKEYRLP